EAGEPAATPATPAPPADGEAPSWTVAAEDVRLSDVRAHAAWDSQRMWGRVGRCRASGVYGDAPRVRVWACELRAGSERDVWLSLDVFEGDYDVAQGGRARIKGDLAGAPLNLRARLPALEEALETYPVDA